MKESKKEREFRHDTKVAFFRLLDDIAEVNLLDRNQWDMIDFTLNECRNSHHYDNEPGMSFEILVENLYECKFPITDKIYNEICRIGPRLGFAQDSWSFLQRLIAKSQPDA